MKFDEKEVNEIKYVVARVDRAILTNVYFICFRVF